VRFFIASIVLVAQAGIASADSPDNLLIALEPEAASIYVRQLRLSQLVPERHTARAHRDEVPPADHVTVNGGGDAVDPAAVEFRSGWSSLLATSAVDDCRPC